jgi:hypothetical protein
VLIEAGGLWETENPRVPVYAVSALWKEREETRYPVVGAQAPMVNTTSCHDGATSGSSCGVIRRIEVSSFAGREGEEQEEEEEGAEGEGAVPVLGLVEVYERERATERLIAGPGDSGGPWFQTSVLNEVTMEGTSVGARAPECPERTVALPGAQFFEREIECLVPGLYPEAATNRGKFERLNIALLPARSASKTVNCWITQSPGIGTLDFVQ